MTYLFSPNFDPNKFDSFLPEASFTLKADAVDSSHSNNTTMGDFINKAEYVKDLFNDMTNDNCQTGSYTKHVKKCLCGFACLVFATVTPYGNSGPASIYYLGIYNFNLGRKSNFNLGYSDTKNLDSCIETVNGQSGLQKGFHVYSIPTEKTKKIDTFFCAEISGNSNYYDFSQFHQSILFPIDDTDKDGMFDDIVTELPSGEYIGMVQKFVRSVAGTGQWIYKRLCKNFGPYGSAYEEVDPATKVSVNSVPDNSIQYIRDIKSGTS